MEFGKIASELLGQVNFQLPADGAFTQQIPADQNPLKIYIGGAKWGIKEWNGLVYPPGTTSKDYLKHYVRQFNCIELNTTHYQIYPETTIAKWAETASERDFLFCPKFPQSISHYSDLSSQKAQLDTDRFLHSILSFGEHLGPSFLQLSEKFGPNRKKALFTYLESLPADLPVQLEVRHPDWFISPNREMLFGKLQKLGIGTVITDVAGRRDCTHMELTSPVAFIRFVGNALHPSDYTRVDAWIERIAAWQQKKLTHVFFHMHQPGELDTPALTDYLINGLNKRLGIQLETPRFIAQTGSLF